ncbi:MAG: DUF3891 family protein [Ardenticatenales bacterium]|nr:DUF3891 family protein [Ardenticatenales bacterium]
MIVNRLDTGWEVIYQPAHALLSAQVAGHWRRDVRPIRWWETLIAVSQHDNGWREWEAAPQLTDKGEPRNFTQMTLPESIAQWERGIARGLHQSRWVGLLISRHASHLYEPRRGEGEMLDDFLEHQAAQRARWQQALGVTEPEIKQAYAMIRWCDWFSLVLCWRRLPEDGSSVALGEGADGLSYEMRQLSDGSVTLDPWPFNVMHFEVSVEARLLSPSRFENDRALLAALESAPTEVRSWTIAKQS